MSVRALTVAGGLFRMSRPDQLLLVAVVYTLGTVMALAWGTPLDRQGYVVGIAALLPVAASIHYANEYADHETDALTERTPYSGGSGALGDLALPRRLPRDAAVLTLLVGVGLALACLAHGLTVVGVGVLLVGAVFGWMYSLPPLALAWNGLGEVDNALLGGMALPLYGFAVQTGRLAPEAALALLPLTLLVFVNLLDTTWPDREADAAVGKATLATRWSTGRLRLTYAGAALAAFALLPVFAGGILPPLVAAASFLALPFLAWGAYRYTERRSPFPTVAGMVVLVIAQLGAWARVAGLL